MPQVRRDSSTPITYAQRHARPLGAQGFASCLRPRSICFAIRRLKRLAIANPDRAPYGRAAVAALKSLKLYDTLKPRIVTAENIAQAAQFVDSGNADAGLISLTSALTPRLSADGTYFVIPRDLYPPIEAGRSHREQNQAARRSAQAARLPPLACQFRLRTRQDRGLTPVK